MLKIDFQYTKRFLTLFYDCELGKQYVEEGLSFVHKVWWEVVPTNKLLNSNSNIEIFVEY